MKKFPLHSAIDSLLNRWILFVGFFLSLVLAAGCQSGADAPQSLLGPDNGDYVPVMPPKVSSAPAPEVSYPAQAWIDRTLNLSFYSDDQLRDIAASSLAAFQLRLLLSPEAQAPLAKIRSYNPEIVILGLLDMEAYYEGWNGAQHRERFPLGADLYDLLSHYTAYRTDGEVATKWENAPMVNPWRSGMVYNRSLMLTQVDIIAHYANEYPAAIDGIFHDNVSINAYIWPQPDDPQTQQADFDRDGVGILDDPDDLAAWQDWQVAFLDELQERFGEGFVQVANGDRPLRRPDFTAHVAGVVLEDFPPTVWFYNYLESMDLIGKIEGEGWCTPRRGRSWSLLWDNNGRNPDYTRTASTLSGAFYALDETTSNWIANDPQAKVMGTLSGPLVRSTLSDGKTRFERLTSAGQAWSEMTIFGFLDHFGFTAN
ncbi:MAG TPA: hypothetical protein VKA63_01330 [Candidatus Krumholzibacteria bacterium]|nr:hypothetical protein [Candidatus Krumholzibacteria bacterium]